MLPVVLKSTDVDAPQSTNAAGSLREIWRWALPQLGWTEAFDDASANKVAFRNSPVDGLGFYVQLDDAGTTDCVPVVGYTSMTGIDTGDNVFGHSPQLYVFKHSGNASSDEWAIVGDNRTFYWIRQTNFVPDSVPHFNVGVFGEFRRFVPVDMANFLVTGIGSSNPSTGGQTPLSFDSPGTAKYGAFAPFSISGLSANAFLNTTSHNNRFIGSNSPSGMISYDGEYVTSDMFIMEGNTLRGALRGVYNASSYIGQTALGEMTINTPAGATSALHVPIYSPMTRGSLLSDNQGTLFFGLSEWL